MYRSQFHDSFQEEQKLRKLQTEKENRERRERLNKMQNYGQLVKKIHKPTISKSKQLEMQKIKELSQLGARP